MYKSHEVVHNNTRIEHNKNIAWSAGYNKSEFYYLSNIFAN